MTTEVRCPHCRQKYEVPNQKLGQDIACKKCGKQFTLGVPEPDEHEPKPPVTAPEATDPVQHSRPPLMRDWDFIWRAGLTTLFVSLFVWTMWIPSGQAVLNELVRSILVVLTLLFVAASWFWNLFPRLSYMFTRPAGWGALFLLGVFFSHTAPLALVAIFWSGFRRSRHQAAYLWPPAKQWCFLAFSNRSILRQLLRSQCDAPAGAMTY